MRIQQMIIGMMLLLSLGVSQAEGEARHYMGIYNDSYSGEEMSGQSYQYGYDFSNLLSMELNYSAPDVTGTTATVLPVDSVGSLMFHFNRRYESITAYFMVGASYIALAASSPFTDELYTGVAYGVGIELYGSKNTAISFTWATTEYDLDGFTTDVDVTRVGLIHHFDFAKSSSRY